MGRYYAITVGSNAWNSQVNGVDDPGALDIEFDFFEYNYGVTSGDAGNSTLTIKGVPLQMLQQAQTFVGQQLVMKAGMSAGYPLANPAQAGTILAGNVFQAFGNWVGTEMALSFVVIPSTFTLAAPGGFVFNWQPGQSLQSAIQQTLSTAYATVSPQPTVVFQISGNYAPQLNGHLTRYSTLRNLGAAVNSMTKNSSPSGTGVFIAFINAGNTILVYDSQGAATPTQIQFIDFIGQPTWVDKGVMQMITVMRADLKVGGSVTMPAGFQSVPGIVQKSAASYPSTLKYETAFQGTFIVQAVRQIGNFRDPAGSSWVTVTQCIAQPVAAP